MIILKGTILISFHDHQMFERKVRERRGQGVMYHTYNIIIKLAILYMHN